MIVDYQFNIDRIYVRSVNLKHLISRLISALMPLIMEFNRICYKNFNKFLFRTLPKQLLLFSIRNILRNRYYVFLTTETQYELIPVKYGISWPLFCSNPDI
jgi:hypothetical protein